MPQPLIFTPGPTQLYPGVKEWAYQAFENDVTSMSHRSQEYFDLHRSCVEKLKALLEVPDDYTVFFMSSATEAMERLIQNCVRRETYHLTNGSFSNRFAYISELLGKQSTILAKPAGVGFSADEVNVPDSAELITLTHNETSTGVSLPADMVNQLKTRYPQKLIAVDSVSSTPVSGVNMKNIDAALFSVQKGFGLPAGLGFLILSPACIDKAHELEAAGIMTGSYHSFTELVPMAASYQTPETPNILAIYLLEKVATDMIEKGIGWFESQTYKKYALLDEAIERHPRLSYFVADPTVRSKTTLALEVEGGSADLIAQIKQLGAVVGGGYGKDYKNRLIRIANFPSQSLSDVEELVQILSQTEKP